MAQRVVDRLEAVEVDEKDGELRAVMPRFAQDPPQVLLERIAVGQARERVVLG